MSVAELLGWRSRCIVDGSFSLSRRAVSPVQVPQHYRLKSFFFSGTLELLMVRCLQLAIFIQELCSFQMEDADAG